MSASDKPQIIATISSVEELDGYEIEAKRRGLTPDEMSAIAERRKLLGARNG